MMMKKQFLTYVPHCWRIILMILNTSNAWLSHPLSLANLIIFLKPFLNKCPRQADNSITSMPISCILQESITNVFKCSSRWNNQLQLGSCFLKSTSNLWIIRNQLISLLRSSDSKNYSQMIDNCTWLIYSPQGKPSIILWPETSWRRIDVRSWCTTMLSSCMKSTISKTLINIWMLLSRCSPKRMKRTTLLSRSSRTILRLKINKWIQIYSMSMKKCSIRPVTWTSRES